MEIQLDGPGLVSLVITVLLPLLVALVTKRVTSSNAKALLLLVLASLNSLGNTLYQNLVNDVSFSWTNMLATAIVGFVIAVSSHYGLWKPTGTAKTLQEVGSPKTIDHDDPTDTGGVDQVSKHSK